MTEADYSAKMAEIDRMLNDPTATMYPGKVWELLEELSSQHRAADCGTNRGLPD
jgi:hypothetical protein